MRGIRQLFNTFWPRQQVVAWVNPARQNLHADQTYPSTGSNSSLFSRRGGNFSAWILPVESRPTSFLMVFRQSSTSVNWKVIRSSYFSCQFTCSLHRRAVSRAVSPKDSVTSGFWSPVNIFSTNTLVDIPGKAASLFAPAHSKASSSSVDPSTYMICRHPRALVFNSEWYVRSSIGNMWLPKWPALSLKCLGYLSGWRKAFTLQSIKNTLLQGPCERRTISQADSFLNAAANESNLMSHVPMSGRCSKINSKTSMIISGFPRKPCMPCLSQNVMQRCNRRVPSALSLVANKPCKAILCRDSTVSLIHLAPSISALLGPLILPFPKSLLKNTLVTNNLLVKSFPLNHNDFLFRPKMSMIRLPELVLSGVDYEEQASEQRRSLHTRSFRTFPALQV